MQYPFRPIKEWSKDDRPREKLRSKNPENLSNAELLAILLRSGTPGKSAIDLAQELLRMGKDNLLELGKYAWQDYKKIKGIKNVKAITIAAAFELGRRRLIADPLELPPIRNSHDLAAYLQARFRDLSHEIFAVVYLNRAGKIKHLEILSSGGIHATVVDTRLILRKALEENAVSLILCHNHPSGKLQPSKADEDLTAMVQKAAKYFDIKLLDHIIVSDTGYFSFADQGLL